MAASPPRPASRHFVPATVGACHWQTAADRFGDEAKAAIRDRERAMLGLNPVGFETPLNWPTGQTTLDDDDGDGSIFHRVPSTQKYRNNLTALSQAYNLYFVAYQSQIFVYVPRSISKQSLPSKPDLRLLATPSNVAFYIGGYVDQVIPHSINHIITGKLGEEEIVVASCDDGDVYAYYVKDIAGWITSKDSLPLQPGHRRRNKPSPFAHPEPFFRENVGISAWGLAIHQKSRLIAVSSNRSEITVFALALSTSRRSRPEKHTLCKVCYHCEQPEAFVRQRSRNWRIIICLGQSADNIPNICFVDSSDGHAEKVSAVDINGTLWVADIWKPHLGVVRLPASDHILIRSEENIGQKSRGWGVVALPRDSFLKVDTLEALVGGTPHEVQNSSAPGRQPMANIEPCIRAIPENPCPPRASGQEGPQQVPLILQGQDALHAIANLLGAAQTGSADGSDESSHEDDMDDDSDGNVGNDENIEAQGVLQGAAQFGPQGDGGDVEDDDEDEGDDEGDDDGEDGVVDDSEEQESDDDEGGAATGFQLDPEEINWGTVGDDAGWPDELVQEWPDDAGLTPDMEGQQEVSNASFDAGGWNGFTFEDSFDHVPVSIEHMEGLPNILSRKRPKRRYCQEHNRPVGDNYHSKQPESESLHENMVYIPHLGRVEPMPMDVMKIVRLLTRPRMTNRNRGGDVKGATKRHRMLRLYEKDLEMMALREDGVDGEREMGILCPDTLTFAGFSERSLRPHFRAASRLNMVAHVPELALVVIASPTGRAMLITPTQLKTPLAWTEGKWKHGFRVEWILPRSSDDIGPTNSRRPLHGMAIGPVQEERGVGGDAAELASVPRRFRLMLHYQNHDIVTYEITREEQTGKLCVF